MSRFPSFSRRARPGHECRPPAAGAAGASPVARGGGSAPRVGGGSPPACRVASSSPSQPQIPVSPSSTPPQFSPVPAGAPSSGPRRSPRREPPLSSPSIAVCLPELPSARPAGREVAVAAGSPCPSPWDLAFGRPRTPKKTRGRRAPGRAPRAAADGEPGPWRAVRVATTARAQPQAPRGPGPDSHSLRLRGPRRAGEGSGQGGDPGRAPPKFKPAAGIGGSEEEARSGRREAEGAGWGCTARPALQGAEC